MKLDPDSQTRAPSWPTGAGGGAASSSGAGLSGCDVEDGSIAERPVAAGWGRRSVRCVWNALLIVGFYAAYAVIRNTHGGRISPAQEARALGHGLAVLDLERRLGLDHETTIQGLFLRVPVLMKASNIFYATAHFTVTAGVLLALTVAGGRRHARWRNILGLATAVALVGFAVYPTMPPRLLPDHPALIDTLSVVGGFWSFQTPVIERIADPYAAIPSLHIVWATWCTCAMWSRLGRVWMRAAALAYPVATSIVVVATANHYLLDVLAGLTVFAGAWLAVRALDSARWAPSRFKSSSSSNPVTSGPGAGEVACRQ